MTVRPAKLTNRQERAILALLEKPTIAAAAQAAGVAERTLRNWLKEPAFVAEFRSARRRLVEQSLGDLQRATRAAVRALRRNLKCGHAGTEVRAALGVLDQSVRAIELIDIEERLTAVEAAQKRAQERDEQ